MTTFWMELRKHVLSGLSENKQITSKLFDYCNNPFSTDGTDKIFPLADEPHVPDWKKYVSGAVVNMFACLQKKIPQLNIPVRKGISKTDAYADVARRGAAFKEKDFKGRLTLNNPGLFIAEIYRHPAGSLPVLRTSDRKDFKTLISSLANRSEPVNTTDSVNAMFVSGFINWDRVWKYREVKKIEDDKWAEEMQRVAKAEPWRFRDSFIILCDNAPYSGVPSSELNLGISEAQWLVKSAALRTEHEFTHYATKRIFGVMRNNVLDELIADCMGMTKVLGKFRADWFLTFMGIADFPSGKTGARIYTYRQELDDDAFALMCALTVKAAHGLENICRKYYADSKRNVFFLALTGMTLELFAANEAGEIFKELIAVDGPHAVLSKR